MNTKSESWRRIVNPGHTDAGLLFLTIEARDGELSISGVEGPMSNGDARGSCGQCLDALDRLRSYSKGWDRTLALRVRSIWDRWHLNHMKPGCSHQRDSWPISEKVEVVTYGLTSEAYQERRNAIDVAARAAARGESANLTDTARALVLLDDWYKDRFALPDADGPLSGCFEVKKREERSLSWTRLDEHPRGLLGKPCEVCGYKYGSTWVREEVPNEVWQELRELPEGSIATLPARWRN